MKIEFLTLPETGFIGKAVQGQKLLRENPGSTLFIAPGRYHVGTEESVRFQEDVIAGRKGHSPSLFTFDVPWQSVFYLEDCHDIRAPLKIQTE